MLALAPEMEREPLALLMRNHAWTIDYFDKLSALCEVAMERLIAHGAPEPECDWRGPVVDPASPLTMLADN